MSIGESDPQPTNANQAPIEPEEPVKELAFRANDGVEVSLLWSAGDDKLRVLVVDAKAGDSFGLEANKDNALDVFYHPYAYAATGHLALNAA